MKPHYGFDDLLIGLSVVSVILAGLGAFWQDVGLASTQWMLIAAVLALWAIYLRLAKK